MSTTARPKGVQRSHSQLLSLMAEQESEAKLYEAQREKIAEHIRVLSEENIPSIKAYIALNSTLLFKEVEEAPRFVLDDSNANYEIDEMFSKAPDEEFLDALFTANRAYTRARFDEPLHEQDDLFTAEEHYDRTRQPILDALSSIADRTTAEESDAAAQKMASHLIYASGEAFTSRLLDLKDHAPSKTFAYLIEALGFVPLGNARSELLELLRTFTRDPSIHIREAAKNASDMIAFDEQPL